MSGSPIHYLHNRVFKLNVGFLLSSGAGHNHNSTLDFPDVRVSDDLSLNFVKGPLRLSRTKEGILVQAELEVAIHTECIRCLDPVDHVMTLHIEELYAFQSDADTEFRINEDAVLDLAPLIRAETYIELTKGALCQPDCKGLCPECGVNLNRETHDCDLDYVDPRLAVLKQLLD